MDWVNGFYSETGRWWGSAESAVTERDRHRLVTLERLAGPGPKRVLELGSAYGNTAVVLAQAGHDVVGVDLSDRIDFARQYEAHAGAGSLTFVKGDFYRTAFGVRFDVVCYWNGFGVGTDADQRRLLRRIADVWLKPHGIALIDVANPTGWIGWAGEEHHRAADPANGYPYDVGQRIDCDPVRNRFVDTWWRTDRPGERWSQDIRCYSPVDFLLLLEGVGLTLEAMEVDGDAFDPRRPHSSAHPLWRAHEYLVKLGRSEE